VLGSSGKLMQEAAAGSRAIGTSPRNNEILSDPGDPAVIGAAPLDRKLCVPTFRWVCRCQRDTFCLLSQSTVNTRFPKQVAAGAETSREVGSSPDSQTVHGAQIRGRPCAAEAFRAPKIAYVKFLRGTETDFGFPPRGARSSLARARFFEIICATSRSAACAS